MRRMNLRAVAVAAVFALAPALALAQPNITSVTPSITSANTGVTVTVSGTGFGALDDRVYFPGTSNWVNPNSAGSGWVVARVPGTWSGNVQVQSHGAGALSNGVNHNISFSRAGQWAGATFTWWLNQNGSPSCTVNQTLDAVAAGYNTWACASGINPSYQGTTATGTSNHTDGINVLGWVNSGWGDPSTIAVCNWRYWIASGDYIEFDISYNSQNWTWSCAGAAGSMDVQNIATHEEGHSIGFLDLYGTFDQNKTMYGWSSNGDVTRRTLDPYDVDGAEYLYSHASRANLTSGTPAGWYGPLVPRNTSDATGASAPLPATLNGNATIYLNEAMANNGGDCASPYGNNTLYLDDNVAWYTNWSGVWGAGSTAGLWLNLGTYVRGGRHTLKNIMDTNADIVESNESDNTYQTQFVWSPYALTDQTPVWRGAPPALGPFGARNCDGFAFTGNWWGCIATIPVTSGDDYDVQLFNDYAGSTTGFSTVLKTSSYGSTNSDFVLFNGNNAGVGYGATRWVGVDRYLAGNGDPFYVSASGRVGTALSPSTTYGSSVTTSTTMSANQIVKVHEVYLGSTTTTYTFKLTNDSGTGDLNISLYAAGGDYYSKGEYVATSQVIGAGTNESFNYLPPSTGYYGLVVWKRNATDLPLANNYTISVGPALSNLNAGVTPGGFSSPVVPRNLSDASYGNAALTTTLDGNTTDTYLNWATQQEGPNNMPAWGCRIYLDVDQYVAWSAVGDGNGPGSWQALNVGAFNIRGGRHELTQSADWNAAVAESNESDNLWSGQWVWSPLVLAKDTAIIRTAPPARGPFTQPNADGMQFTRTAGYAWVVGSAGNVTGDDYDMYCYDDYTNSSTGFSNLRKSSAYGSNLTDFVVGHYSGTPGTVYPAVVLYSAGGGGQPLVADQSDSYGRAGSASEVVYANQSLGVNRINDVYEGYFFAGTTYHIVLTRNSGSADVSFAVFPGTASGIYNRGEYAGASVSISSTRDTLAFTAGVTGWHPIVVYRYSGSDLLALTYSLAWNTISTVDVPRDEERFTLDFAGASPNPMADRTRLAFTLAQPGEARLALYDLVGRRVRVLAQGVRGAGRHEVMWDGTGEDGARLGAGLYWARLEVGGRSLTKRVTVLR